MSTTFSSSPVHTEHGVGRPFTAEDLWKIPRIGAPVPVPGARSVVIPVVTYDLESNEGTSRLYLASLDSDQPRALTSPECWSGAPRVSPDGKRLAFTRKEGEEKRPQLYVMPLDGGEAERVCEMPLGCFDPRWMPDGSGIVFGAWLYREHPELDATRAEQDRREDDPVRARITEERVFRFWDTWLAQGRVPHLFLLDFASGETRDLMLGSTDWFPWMEPAGTFDIAPDGEEVAHSAIRFDDEHGRLRSWVHRIDLQGNTIARFVPPDAHTAFRPRYTPDGSAILFGATYDPDFYADRVRLLQLDRATGETTPVLTDWELSPADWEFVEDGSILFHAQSNARTHAFRLAPGESEPTIAVRGGTVSGVLPIGTEALVYLHQNLTSPADLFVDENGRNDIIAPFGMDSVDDIAFGDVHEALFGGADGEGVQMFLVFPPRYDPSRTYPLVHVIHGGPHGISADSFHPRWNAQLFAAPGYIAVLVNFQGSTSWGQDFARCIQGAWGDRPYRDIMAATDVLEESGLVDPDRMAVAGGSYGGYMVNWITSQTDRFKASVNHAGVFDTQGMFASDVIQGRHISLGGRPYDETADVLDRWNPIRHAGAIKTPTLVIHGEKDYRVPITQGLLCYSILRDRGVPARLLYYPDENHWVLKPRNSLLWYREVHAWLARYLGGSEDADRPA